MRTRPCRSPWSADGKRIPCTMILLSERKRKQLRHRTDRALPPDSAMPDQGRSSSPGTPAAQAGLHVEMTLSPWTARVHTVDTMLAHMQAGKGKPITLSVCATASCFHRLWLPGETGYGLALGFAAVPPTNFPVHDEPFSLLEASGRVAELLRGQIAPDLRGPAEASSRIRFPSRSSPVPWASRAWPVTRPR